ncbi:hypothetical protein GCM10012286_07540 [Streptomyces lasiicapitis]|uniref:Secreted protein n=1 Tax=Streptomyces lasiicapitis TaxID=1923961 RepID=A0ABQ2LIP9_9ACTN|nr:hypothetical protein GCM10012286_07540 [Streptomyces lasiicapitis]
MRTFLALSLPVLPDFFVVPLTLIPEAGTHFYPYHWATGVSESGATQPAQGHAPSPARRVNDVEKIGKGRPTSQLPRPGGKFPAGRHNIGHSDASCPVDMTGNPSVYRCGPHLTKTYEIHIRRTTDDIDDHSGNGPQWRVNRP